MVSKISFLSVGCPIKLWKGQLSFAGYQLIHLLQLQHLSLNIQKSSTSLCDVEHGMQMKCRKIHTLKKQHFPWQSFDLSVADVFGKSYTLQANKTSVRLLRKVALAWEFDNFVRQNANGV